MTTSPANTAPTKVEKQDQPTMSISPTRASTLLANLSTVRSRISIATASASNSSTTPVRLVAVSKLKPASDILALYNPPSSAQQQFHFGENYLQELLEKSRILPPEIRWHFIGGLQSNKCVTLARDVRGLWAVESLDSEKKASLLNKGWGERKTEDENTNTERLRVFVQVNTSGEENKSGVQPGENTVSLCRFIREKCPRLKLQGLMTIGAIARSQATTPENENEDFVCLKEARDRVDKELGLEGDDALELSMGMSEDFEGAIALGSNQVRVGSTIFGPRPPKSEAKVTPP